MSSPDSSWLLEISFPRPYHVEVERGEDGELVIRIPFISEPSAQFARDEMDVAIRPRVRMVAGEVVDESRMILGEVVEGEQET